VKKVGQFIERYRLPFLLLFTGCLLSLLPISKLHAAHSVKWLVYRNLKYGPDPMQGLDLFVPGNRRGPFPLIVFIHGGGWAAGDKADATFFELSKRGWALASINYRLLWEKAFFPAQILDCKAAVAFLRQNAVKYQLDPERIGVWGCSSGGQLAMLVATTGNGEVRAWESESNGVSSRVQAVCDWSGPSDLVTLLHSRNLERRMRVHTKNLVGPLAEGREARLAVASPVNYIKRGDPPVLVMHACGDKMVPLSQSQELIECLKANGVESKFIAVNSPEHCFYTFENEALVADFFDRALKRPHL
jgi:acetyl esterase/lipase